MIFFPADKIVPKMWLQAIKESTHFPSIIADRLTERKSLWAQLVINVGRKRVEDVFPLKYVWAAIEENVIILRLGFFLDYGVSPKAVIVHSFFSYF